MMRELYGQDKHEPEKRFKEELRTVYNKGCPRGSERFMRVNIHRPEVVDITENLDEFDPTVHLVDGSLYWGYVTFEGDLRDESDPGIIQKWLNNVKLPEGCVIRNGVCEVDDEKDKYVLQYMDTEEKWGWLDLRGN